MKQQPCAIGSSINKLKITKEQLELGYSSNQGKTIRAHLATTVTPEPIFSVGAASTIAAMTKFRLVKLPTGEFCATADSRLVEGYPYEPYSIKDCP
jgi:hypothetical protein